MNKWLSDVQTGQKARARAALFSRHTAAVLLAAGVLTFAAHARAQEPGPNVLTPAQVQEAARTWFGDDQLTVATLLPQQRVTPGAAPAQPAAMPPRDVQQ